MEYTALNQLICRLKRDSSRLYALECVHNDAHDDNEANLLREINADIIDAIEFLTSEEDEDDYDCI